MAFPPNLSNVERCYVHQIAQEMGLKTKSFGKNEDRYLTVFKQGEQTIFDENVKYCSVKLTEKVVKKIEDFLTLNPLTQEEMEILQEFSTSTKPEKTSEWLKFFTLSNFSIQCAKMRNLV